MSVIFIDKQKFEIKKKTESEKTNFLTVPYVYVAGYRLPYLVFPYSINLCV